MTENLKRCPFCGGTANIAKGRIEFWAYCPHCGAKTGFYETEQEVAKAWNTRQVEGELLKKYENALFEICFCCAAVDCSLEQQSEALKAIDKMCAEFYSIPEEELRGKNERR